MNARTTLSPALVRRYAAWQHWNTSLLHQNVQEKNSSRVIHVGLQYGHQQRLLDSDADVVVWILADVLQEGSLVIRVFQVQDARIGV